MARYSPEHAATVRSEILSEAAAVLRASGPAKLSISSLMKRLGLTHGGFYRHFASRDALVSEAAAQALARGVRHVQHAMVARGGGIRALIDTYLSPGHRDHPEAGCAIAALAGELARLPPEQRAGFSRSLEETLMLVRMQLPPDHPDPDRAAIGVLSTMVGGLLISRLAAEPTRAHDVLQAAAAAALATSR